MTALYNEIEPFAVEWMRNLESRGHIAPGVVDDRSITELRADELAPYTQAHFFAGIGVWSYALRAAGWPDGAPVWTGSCPCQPFSAAGRRGGFDDARHLWPVWFNLIRQCRPPVVFGEQVEGADGRAWLDLVSADLEGIGYAFAAAILPAAGVGAPHVRHRTYFMAHALPAGRAARGAESGGGSTAGRGGAGELGHALREGAGRDTGAGVGAEAACGGTGSADRRLGHELGASGATRGFWAGAEWIPCRDGKWRPVEPGSFPLASGSPGRVGRLRAYGNAINAEVAATFIRAAREVMPWVR